MSDNVREFLKGAAAKRIAGATERHRERRRVVDARNEKLQRDGIKRGPNAPKDKTFGKAA